jgi:hypothetical protein
VRRAGEPLGTRCEIKNLNSFRFMEKAIEFEVRRQVELIEDGGKVVQETRLFDPDRGETRPMRSKEDAHDYRYFPIPTCCRSRSARPGSRASASHAEPAGRAPPQVPRRIRPERLRRQPADRKPREVGLLRGHARRRRDAGRCAGPWRTG